MPTPLRVLLLEDQPADAELSIRELVRAGFEPDWKRVETEGGFAAALHPDLDVVLADCSLPQFDALSGLSCLQSRGLDVPFIVVTGTFEDMAVECMRRGAADYLLKDRLTRLGPAVLQAMESRKEREAKRRADAALRESEERFHLLVDGVKDHALFLVDPEGRVMSWNAG